MMSQSNVLRDKTVLVLGAGASRPYGFPLGEQLREHLASYTDPAVLQALQERGCDREVIREFQDALRFGVHTTIDIFLERKTNFREIGAYFISAAINQFEKGSALFPERDWYADLYHLLDFESATWDFFDFSIVTLNYDRSLEHFLTKNIDYNCEHRLTDSCHKKRKSLKIIHAHGSIGPYPEAPYGDVTRNIHSLRRAADGIKIVSDKLDESNDFRAAQDAIAKAEHIIFLGFGYNERTLQALLSKTDFEKAKFYGTGMLDDSGRQAVLDFFKGKIVLGDIKQDCLGFFRSLLRPKGSVSTLR